MYGALPPETRRRQVEAFSHGEAELLFATDVIGHGVNLPADTVVFAETNKFDGISRRALVPWEVAQIAGRAGRFGLSERGSVRVLVGATGFTSDAKLVAKVVNGGGVRLVNGQQALRDVSYGYVGPALPDLPATKATGLKKALAAWGTAAKQLQESHHWARAASVQPMVSRLGCVQAGVLEQLTLHDAWSLARAPLDPMANPEDAGVFIAVAKAVTGDRADLAAVLRSAQSAVERKQPAAVTLEKTARILIGLRWATLAFESDLGLTHQKVTELLELAVARLDEALGAASKVARCSMCAKVCAPWFAMCDPCHARQYARYDDYDDYDDDDDYRDDAKARKAYEKSLANKRACTELRQALDQQITDAAASSALLGRPKFFNRQMWLDVAIPAIQRADAKTGAAICEALSGMADSSVKTLVQKRIDDVLQACSQLP